MPVLLDGARLLELAMENVSEDGTGICRACGAVAYGVEPDARRYACESCGAREVFGCEELIVMYAT